MTSRWLVPVLALLPLVGMAASVTTHLLAERGATEWRIPVAGRDPRDLVRGHYAAFSYAWTVDGSIASCKGGSGGGCVLCLKEGGRRVVIAPPATACAGRIDPVASVLLRGARDFGASSTFEGTRVWIPEADAARIDRQLRAGQLVAVAKLTPNGRLIAKRLEPAP